MSKTKVLIEIVKNYPILYDLKHGEYKNIRKKEKIWNEIGKELNENGDDLKKKWKNLRDTYAKYIRSSKAKTGQAANNMKKWLWAEQMKAFRPYLAFAKASSNVSDINSTNSVPKELQSETNAKSENLENENVGSENVDSVPTEATEDTELQETNQQILNVIQPSQLPVSNVTPTASTANNKTGRTHNSTPSSSVGEMVKYFINENKIEYDATECLLLAHAKTIKTFSGRRQAITKWKIAQVIMEQELLHQDEVTLTNTVPRPESENGSHPSTSSG